MDFAAKLNDKFVSCEEREGSSVLFQLVLATQFQELEVLTSKMHTEKLKMGLLLKSTLLLFFPR